jgi:hypothetical protein
VAVFRFRKNYKRLVIAGFAATCAMTLLAYIAPLIGLPRMDFAAMLGSVLNQVHPPAGTPTWWLGMIWHIINGTFIFPFFFEYFFYILPGKPWQKGVCFSLVLWFLSMTVAMPLLNYGFLAGKSPQQFLVILGSLIGHVVYGTILGTIAGWHKLFNYVSGTKEESHLGKNRLSRYEQKSKT